MYIDIVTISQNVSTHSRITDGIPESIITQQITVSREIKYNHIMLLLHESVISKEECKMLLKLI